MCKRKKKKTQSPSDEPFLSETAGGSRLSLLQIYTQDVLRNVPSSESNHQKSKNLTQLSGRGPYSDFITMTTAEFLPISVQSPDVGFLMEQGGV